jgi:hypothetical protein
MAACFSACSWSSMVVDLEALVFASRRAPCVAEQAAYVIVDAAGREVEAAHFVVLQDRDADTLAAAYGLPRREVAAAVDAYCRITGDADAVHIGAGAVPWRDVRRCLEAAAGRAGIVYAKGAELERRLLPELRARLYDLEWFGCPRFPHKPHDPLAECRFFAQYVPVLQ